MSAKIKKTLHVTLHKKFFNLIQSMTKNFVLEIFCLGTPLSAEIRTELFTLKICFGLITEMTIYFSRINFQRNGYDSRRLFLQYL